jgi:endogenous inhibitor of DNA gyrase (YacG/DUF329 family)
MSENAPRSAKQCPICRRPTVERYRPFCSKRCADIDLNRWLSGAYVVPGSADAEEDGGGADLGAASDGSTETGPNETGG